jgi:hypothetical protein
LSASSAVSASFFHLSSDRSADFESFAEDVLASIKMSQDFLDWVGKLDFAPATSLPRVRRNPFMLKSRLLAFVIKEFREILPPTVCSSQWASISSSLPPTSFSLITSSAWGAFWSQP